MVAGGGERMSKQQDFFIHQRDLLQLRSDFQERAICHEEKFLLLPDDAIEFLVKGVELGLCFVGIDGFSILHTGCLQRLKDFSNDIDDSKVSYEEFIVDSIYLIESGRPDQVLFEVVFFYDFRYV